MLSDAGAIDAIRRLSFADSPRNRLYSRMLDDGLDEALRGFDFAQRPFGDPESTRVRLATSLTGYMAFCHANPWSRYHRDPRLREHVRQRLREFARTHRDGMIEFRGKQGVENRWEAVRGSHGNSWYIEPLMLAAWWMEADLADDERAGVRALIRRAADMHAAIPIDEMNNRGVIRSAILCMAGRFLDDPRLVDIGKRDFHREPARVFNAKDGQINEGTGPDANYSGTTYIYAYIYRVFSGDAAIDEPMAAAARWATWVFDPTGWITLFGASTRMPYPDENKVADFLPAWERYADANPHFSWLIDHGYLGDKRLGGPFHAVSPLIWAMLEHDGRAPVEDPGWREHRRLKDYNPKAGPEFMYTNEGYAALYFVLRGDYHATTTLWGRSPYKGLQHWSYGTEPPVAWPTESHASKTIAWGVDTSQQNASGTKFRDKRWYEGPPHVLVARFENVWHHYVLTRTTLLLLISSSVAPRDDIWVVDKRRCGQPSLGPRCLEYPGRRGRLHFAQDPAELRELDNAWHLRFAAQARTLLYAFSNESFRVLEFDPGGDRLSFADDTGRYELEYELRFFDPDAIRSIGAEGNDVTSQIRTAARRLGT